jgi:hypothetical protein
MHRLYPDFAPSLRTLWALSMLCALAVLSATPGHAQSAAPAASTVAVESEAYREWQRQHEEWQRGYNAWEKRYAKWIEEQARLDDGFMLTVGVGPSPIRVNTAFSGGDRINFPDIPPFPNMNFRGIGGALDVRMGWLVQNDPYLKDYWFGDDELHDQLYLTVDLLSRSSAYPQLRFAENDSANQLQYFRPVYMLDLVGGVGMTYLVYPYRTSISTTVGFGLLGIQGKNSSVRTNIGPAFNLRIGQEWALRENWRSGLAVNYGFAQSINPRKITTDLESYQENYSSHMFSIQWINTITPPKYRRGIPPSRPQQYDNNAPPQYR